jgi:hypothetical protein
MNQNTSRTVRMLISVFNAGVISGASVLLTHLSGNQELTKTAIMIAAVTALVQACTNLQAYISAPPGAQTVDSPVATAALAAVTTLASQASNTRPSQLAPLAAPPAAAVASTLVTDALSAVDSVVGETAAR